MKNGTLRRGDVVEVRGADEIFATLDRFGALEALPFMPEMVPFCGRTFRVAARVEKICDTVHHWGSRRMRNTVFLEDLRCDGARHGDCQAECRLYWKEAWLRLAARPSAARNRLNPDLAIELIEVTNAATHQAAADGATRYSCQATQVFEASQPLKLLDVRQYVRELARGNLGLGRWTTVMTRALVTETRRRLGKLPNVHLAGNAQTSPRAPRLGLEPGDRVRVKDRDAIAATMTSDGKNRGLSFDREMLPFCGP